MVRASASLREGGRRGPGRRESPPCHTHPARRAQGRRSGCVAATPWVSVGPRAAMSHGVWRVAGARWVPLHPSLAERDRNVTCEEWLLYDILGQLLPSLGKCFHLTGIHTDGDFGKRFPVLTERPQDCTLQTPDLCMHVYIQRTIWGNAHFLFPFT